MIVVSMLGGLGSQMCKYAFLLAVREKSQQECLIDTSFYLQRSSWNGYELGRIFPINEKDLKDLLSEEEKETIIQKKIHYLTPCLNYLLKTGPVDYYFMGSKVRCGRSKINQLVRLVHHKFRMVLFQFGIQGKYPDNVYRCPRSVYFDEYSMNSDELFSDYRDLVVKAFSFPPFVDQQNISISEEMNKGNSVAIHVRRSDHLGDNKRLFENGYYKKAVTYIKDKTHAPQKYYVFSEDIKWCIENKSELGLTDDDFIVYVDWNTGESSYRDMQLMTCCQHNVLAISSFSWWGYYLSPMKDKIVCAPVGYWDEVENHF
jgi:hypothetical protein